MDVLCELRQMNRYHEPSYTRGMIRLARKAVSRESDISPIITAARNLKDPYYSSYALSGIAKTMYSAGIKGYERLFNEACRYASQVKQEWRCAEIIVKVASEMSQCRITDFSEAIAVVAKLTEETQRKEAFRGLIRGIAKVNGQKAFSLLHHATDKKEMSIMVKTVVNESLRFETVDISSLEEAIANIEDPYVRSKGLIYLGMKASTKGLSGATKYFEMALRISNSVNNEPFRFELLKYLSDKVILSGEYDISNVILASDTFDEAHKVSLLCYIAAGLFKNSREGYSDLYREAVDVARRISDPEIKYKALKNIANGMEKAGLNRHEDVLEEASIHSGEVNEERKATVLEGAKEDPPSYDLKGTLVVENDTGRKSAAASPGGPIRHKRIITMGLYNTYEKKLSSAHVRAMARAAPLCYAYGLSLCLFGFPFQSAQEALEKVSFNTSVDKGGFFLNLLKKEGRFHVSDDIYEGVLGTLVATTSHPDPKKLISLEYLKKSKDLCFLLGVGKKGLPGSVLSYTKYHLEFSGQNIPFETSTAMGILAYMLKNL